MKVIRAAPELERAGRPVCLAVGMFDGVHLGHQQVIRQTVEDARQHGCLPVAVTFDRHPNAVVAPEHTPPLIYPLSRKLQVMKSLGIEATWLIHFDRAFSEQPAEDFVRELVRGFDVVRSLCVGSAFTFGHRRSGNVALLQRLGEQLQFTVHGLASVSLGEQAVSSTRIRETIRAGDLDAAGQMLGRSYALIGSVIRGDRIGRQIGFPTANLDVAGLVLPPNGVYAAQVLLQERPLRGAVNIGTRPTLQNPNPQLQVEVHLLDFAEDIYGQELQLTFIKKLREEQRFSSRATLLAQIQRDLEAVRASF
jgi:riboflavin kinase / FMN adenylyltransferase